MDGKGITLAGNLIMDIGYTIDRYPEKGNLTQIHAPAYHTGGLNNLLIDLARLDPALPLKANGLVGEDENGQRILDALSAYPNIDTRHIHKVGRTAITYAMTEAESKLRTFFCDSGTSFSFNEGHIDLEKLDADIFHLEYLLYLGELDEADAVYGTKAAKVLSEAQKRGMKTSVDVVSDERKERYPEVVWPALRYTDYCIINEVEASGIVGDAIYDASGIIEEKGWSALERLKELGVREWAIIHSPKCGYGLNCLTGEKIKVPSLDLPKGFIKGTIGAGDAFCSGVLYAAYHGMDLASALRLGAKCAACSLSEEDSNSGVVAYENIDKVLEEIE